MISRILDEPHLNSFSLVWKLKSLSPDQNAIHFTSIDDLCQYISLCLYYGTRLRSVICVSGERLKSCEEVFEFLDQNAVDVEQSLLISIASLIQFEELKGNKKEVSFNMERFLKSSLEEKCRMINLMSYLKSRNLEELFMYPSLLKSSRDKINLSRELKFEIISMTIISFLTTFVLYYLIS